MKKVIQYFSHYLIAYTFQLTAVFIHELSHYLITIITWFLSMTSFPIMKIDRWFTTEEDKDGTWWQRSFNASVNFNVYGHVNADIISGITASGPIFGTILLFYFSPWYICLLAIPLIPTLWLSQGDLKQIKQLFIIIKNMKNSKLNQCVNVERQLFFYPDFKKNKSGKRTGSRRVVAGVIDDKNQLHIGVAQCTKTDIFVKKAGKKIALQRALSSKVPHIVAKIENPNRITEQFVAIAKKAQALPKNQL